MADFDGLRMSSLLTSKYTGYDTPVADWRVEPLDGILFGDTDDGPGPLTPTGTDTFTGVDAVELSFGLDWFDKVHLVPTSIVDFGNIGGIVEREFELFNANRRDAVALTNIVNNATPGMSVPDVVAPDTLPAFASFLDPTTTDNTGGSGLGTLVRTVAVAEAQGLPTFDTSIVFTFSPGGDLELLVTGDRIALITAEPEAPVAEILEFKTNILTSLDGTETAVSMRKEPRQKLVYNYALEGAERRRMQHILFGWQAAVFAVPVWQEAVTLRAAASVSDTSVTVSTTTDVDFRVGGLAVIFESETKFDVVQISGIGSNTVSFTASPLLNSYAVADDIRVIPVRLAHLNKAPSHGRPPKNLERFNLEFRVIDNVTGAPAASTSGWSTHDGKVLLDDFNIASENSGEMEQVIAIIDNETGAVYQKSDWASHKRTHLKGFRAGSRAEILKLKKLLLALRGNQVTFWIPTFNEDLNIVNDLVNTAVVMDIEHVGYTRFVASKEPKKTFRITFTDGTSLVREIQSSVEIDSTTERLTIDTGWPADRTVAEVERIEFFEKVRFATSEFRLDYDRPGLARMIAPVKVAL